MMIEGRQAEIDVTGEKLATWDEKIDFLLDIIARRGASASSAEVQLAEYLRCNRVWAQHKLDKLRRSRDEQMTECREEMDVALRALDQTWRALARRLDLPKAG